MNLQTVQALDAADPLKHKLAEFILPAGMIYLDGNSLGCLPVAARERARQVVEEQWGQDLISSWNCHNWIDLPLATGEKIAPLIGAAPGQTVCCDSVSVNLFKLLAAALAMQPGRSVILSQRDNFPTDLYMAEGLSVLLGADRARLKLVEEQEIVSSLDESVAVLMLTHVNFRTGSVHDLQQLTLQAHAQGVLVVWDLSHSAGVLPVDLDKYQVDFAVGCGYKYLNGGPGAPAYLYAASRHHDRIFQPLTGWMGHKIPFAFEVAYEPVEGVARFLSGTPSVIAMSIFHASLDVFQEVDVRVLREKSLGLAELFRKLVAAEPCLAPLVPGFPEPAEARGAQLAYCHPHAFAICQALIARGVVADFRAPDRLRLGFSPLTLSYLDVREAVVRLTAIMHTADWKKPEYARTGRVT